MTTNQEWLFSMTLEEYLKWMESECSEPKDDVSSYGADFKAVEMDASRFEAVEMDASRLVVGEPDSREKLEAEASELVAEYAASGDVCDALYHGMLGLLDRQAAITEEKTRYKWVTASAEEIAAWKSKAEKLKEQVYELTAERDKLQEQLHIGWECECRLQAERDELKAEHERIVQELVDVNTRQCERTNELTAERDNWKANCEDWKKDCERYREKFGKCLDYADAIHALMDDEGMA